MAGDETGLRFRFSFPALQDYRDRATVFSDGLAEYEALADGVARMTQLALTAAIDEKA